MKRIYLHIGTHKTGTTAIQSFSAQHTTRLNDLGIYYPELARPTDPGIKSAHHLLPWYIMRHPVPGRFFGNFENKKESLIPSLIDDIKSIKCNHVVLSSEEFDCLNQEQIETLRNYLRDFDVQVMVYLRRKDTYLESMYQTTVVYFNESRTLVDMVDNMKMPLNYFDFVNRWQNVFGKENVLVRFYCKKSMRANNVVIDFYHQLGVDVEEMIKRSSNKVINQSVPLHYVAAIVTLRRMGVSDHFINTIKSIAKKIGDETNRHYHILSLQERIQYANSGLDEINKLNLTLPDKECFRLSEVEINENEKKGHYSALKKVFDDFENVLNKKN